jgi:hypothetical protein
MIDFLNNLAVYEKNSSTMIRSQLVSHFIPWPTFLSGSHDDHLVDPPENNFLTNQPSSRRNNYKDDIAGRTEEKQALPSLQPELREGASSKVANIQGPKSINPSTIEFRPPTISPPTAEKVQLEEKNCKPQNSSIMESTILSSSNDDYNKNPNSSSISSHIRYEITSTPDQPRQQNSANNPTTSTNISIGPNRSQSFITDGHASSDLTIKPRNVSSSVMPEKVMKSEKRNNSAHNKTATVETNPTIRVNIGRIEVRAIHSTAPLPSPKTQSAPLLSLQDYLKQRNGG